MRDAHRMKEKFDLSLDNRQIVSLLIGGIVVLGAVFVLGVVVGKKLSTSEQTAQAPDLLSALDDAAARSDAEAQLTFQETLTEKQPAALQPPPPPAPKPEPVKVETAKAPEAAKPEVAKAEPAKAADSAKAEVVKASAEGSANNGVVVASANVATDAAPSHGTEMPEAAGQVEDSKVATSSAAKDGGLKDAFARATGKPPAEAVAGGAWTLQLSASQSKDEADKFAARLRDRGYAPFIVKAEVPGRGTWYRVRMGSFGSKDAANRYLQDFKRETQMDAFVASNN